LDFIKDVGLPLGALLVAIAVGWAGYRINKRDALMKQSSVLSGYLSDLLSADAEKQNSAAIKLADYGSEAQSVVLVALASSTKKERHGPILAVKYMFEWGRDSCPRFFGWLFGVFETTSEEQRICRSKLLEKVLRDSSSSNQYLRAGSLESLAAVADTLNDDQKLQVLKMLEDRLGSEGELADQNEKDETVMEDSVLLLAGVAVDDALKLLVGLVRNSGRKSVQIESLESLRNICKQSSATRRKWVAQNLGNPTLKIKDKHVQETLDSVATECDQLTVPAQK
jgi:hypothetical protein